MNHYLSKFVLVCLCLLFLSMGLLHAQGAWQKKNNFSGAARSGAVSFEINGTIYVGTGESAGGYLKDFWKYIPATDTWMPIADFGGAGRKNAIAFSINGKGYVGTGTSGPYNARVYYSDVWEYDPLTDRWQEVAPFGGGTRESAVVFTISNKAYIGTGKNESTYFKDLWEYNPATNAWTGKANLPGYPRTSAIGFALGAKGYVGTGFYFDGSSSITTNDLYAYDPATNTWSEKVYAHIALGRQDAVNFVVDGIAYFGAGLGKKDFWKYDPTENSLSSMADFGLAAEKNRSYAVSFVHNKIPYVGLGNYAPDFLTTTKKQDIWAFYIPTPPVAPTELSATVVSHSQINLLWKDNSSNETGFVVEKATGGSADFTVVATLAANTTTYSNTGLTENTSYTYRIKAVNSEGASAFTTAVSKTTALMAPLNVFAWPLGENKVEISWKKGSDLATGFKVERSTNKETGFVEIATLDNSKYLFRDEGLSNSITYYYRIKAYSTSNSSMYANLQEATPGELGAWVEKQQLDVGVGRSLNFVIGNKGYTGVNNNFGNEGKAWFEYSPAENRWTQKADFPGQANPVYANGFKVGNKGYVGGGQNRDLPGYHTTFWSYDPETDSWKSIANIPEAQQTQIGFEINGKGYLAGPGRLFEYNPATDSWSAKAGFPGVYRPGFVAFVIGNKAYVGGGDNKTDFWAYDPETNSWSRIADCPVTGTSDWLTMDAAFALNGKGYVFRSKNADSGEGLALGVEYDPTLNKWFKKVIIPGIIQGVAFPIEGKGYILLRTNNEPAPMVYEFNPNALNSPADLVAVTNDQNQITLNWTDHTSEETAYVVTRSDTAGGEFIPIDTLAANEVKYVDSNVTLGYDYSYRVYAINMLVASGNSNIASAGFLGRPERLEAYLSTPYSASFKFHYPSDNATHIIVDRTTPGSEKYTSIDTVSLGEIQLAGRIYRYLDSDVSEGKVFLYKVRTYKNGVASTFSDPVQVTVPLIAPYFFSAYLETKQVRLNWEEDSQKETYFQIERSFANTENFIVMDSVGENETTWNDKVLPQTGKYYYRIKAINSTAESEYTTVDSVEISTVLSTLEKELLNQTITVFPNPGKDQFVLQFEEAVRSATITVINQQGKIIRKVIGNGKLVFVSLKGEPSGLYGFRVQMEKGSFNIKVIKE